jgi:glutaredoxin-related protein
MFIISNVRDRFVHSSELLLVFIGGQHIGGNSDLQGLYSDGQLQSMLENVMARHA